ncbi:MAG: hypothetical protein ACRDKG_07170 [Actinomycetota bacterium]
MKRRSSILIAIVSIVAVLAMLTPASAATGFIVAGPGATSVGYLTRPAILQKGMNLKFVNLDIPQHDVVMAHNTSIRSPLIGVGKQAFVVGANTLPKGTFGFFCSIHPNMRGNLRVI